MKKLYSTFLICFVISLNAFAQPGSVGILLMSPEKQGDFYYRNFAYQDAVEAYQKAFKKAEANDFLKLKIAESFQRLNKPVEAEKWYSLISAKDSVFKPEHFLAYAEALSSTGKYQEAQKWFLNYQELSDDKRAERKIKGISVRKELEHKNEGAVKIEAVAFNSEASDFSPAFYKEGVLFLSGRRPSGKGNLFQWDKSNFLDLYYSSSNIAESAGIFHKTLNSPYHEGPVVVYENGSKIIFTRNNYGGKVGRSSEGVTKLKLYYSEKMDSLDWSKPVALPFNSDEFSTGHPSISIDGTTLYFASDRPGGFGKTDLYKSELKNGVWGVPENLGNEINTEGDEMFPFLHQDQILYFASNGHAGLGGLDVVGIDLNKGARGEVLNLGAPINTRFDDFGLIVENSGMAGYFSSNRPGGAGMDDVFRFTSAKALMSSFRVIGQVMEAIDLAPLAGTEIQLLNEKGKVLESVVCTEDGNFSFGEVVVNSNYQLQVLKTGYQEKIKKIITIEEEGPEWRFDIRMNKEQAFSLYALIREEHSKEEISGVLVSVFDNMTGQKVLETTTAEGSGTFVYSMKEKKIKDRISFQIKLSKEGYLGKTITYNAALEEAGQINLHEMMDLYLTKIEIGADIGKLMNIQPIFFDLGKAIIRKDAAKELDKVVLIMKENPDLFIELGSHSDARGSSASNLQLSDKRAKASADYIISMGIDKSRILGKGYGEQELLNHCADGLNCSEKEHQQNRRTSFKVTKF